MSKSKTYSKHIFSGKEIPFIGISEGHGKLFRGNSVEFSMNVNYKGAIESRGGSVRGDIYDSSIRVVASGNIRALCVGNSIFAEVVQ